MTISKFTQGLDALLDQTKKMNAESCDTLGISPEDVEVDPADDNSVEDNGSDVDNDESDVSSEVNVDANVEDNADEATIDEAGKASAGTAIWNGLCKIVNGATKNGATLLKAGGEALGTTGKVVAGTAVVGGIAANRYFDNDALSRLEKDKQAQQTIAYAESFLKTEEDKTKFGDAWATAYSQGKTAEEAKAIALSTVGKTQQELDAWVANNQKIMPNAAKSSLETGGFGWKDAAVIGGVALAAPLAIHYGKKLIDKIRGNGSKKKTVSGSKRKTRLESVELCEDGTDNQIPVATKPLTTEPTAQTQKQIVKVVPDNVENNLPKADVQDRWLENNGLTSSRMFKNGYKFDDVPVTQHRSFDKAADEFINGKPLTFADIESGKAAQEKDPYVKAYNAASKEDAKTPEQKKLDARANSDLANLSNDTTERISAIDARTDLTPEQKSALKAEVMDTASKNAQSALKGEYGFIDRAKTKAGTYVDKTRSLISGNPLAAVGIAAGAGALASGLLGRRRRRDEGTESKASSPKVLVGHGNPIGKGIEPVATDEGLLQIAGQVVGGALGGMAGAGMGADLGGRIASGALMTTGSMAGAKVGQMLEPEEEVREGVVDSVKDGWEGTKNFFKKNARIILPTLGTVGGLAYGASTKNPVAPAMYGALGGMAGHLASSAIESTETKPSVVKDFNDFKTWKLNKYGC